ncbi:type II secretion system inner membrane protein GspF [soil metagenome]
MNADDVTALNEQLAAMARAGLPLDKGLESLARDLGRGNLKHVTEKLVVDLQAGMSLDEAIQNQGGKLPPYYGYLVAAGVRTGRLPEVLSTLTNYTKTISLTRGVILEALLYPAIVVLFGFAIFGFLIFYLLPQFDEIFTEFGISLPWITKSVLSVSRIDPLYLILPFAGLILATIAVYLGTRFTVEGRRLWAQFIYHIPVVGTLLRSARLASFTELLGMLVDHEVPLPEAFRVAGLACSEPIMARKARIIADDLTHGTPLAVALQHRGLVPEWMAWLSGSGERKSDLAGALKQVAVIYRRQVDARLAILRSVFPSFVIILTAGTLTTVFTLAVMLPLFKLLEGLSK